MKAECVIWQCRKYGLHDMSGGQPGSRFHQSMSEMRCQWHEVQHDLSVITLAIMQDMLREMQEEMKEADIPTEYGGQSTGELYASPEEMQILHHVQQLASSS